MGWFADAGLGVEVYRPVKVEFHDDTASLVFGQGYFGEANIYEGAVVEPGKGEFDGVGQFFVAGVTGGIEGFLAVIADDDAGRPGVYGFGLEPEPVAGVEDVDEIEGGDGHDRENDEGLDGF